MDAIEAAGAALKSSSLSAYDRYESLTATVDRVEERLEEIVQIVTSEKGNLTTEARNEVDRTTQTLQLSAEEATRQFGEYIPMDV
jgi:lactaldehyde dehydrogenase